jgi:hypothetical protein
MLAEWAYVRLKWSNEERLRALPAWIDFYNLSRPHIALGGHPPMARLSTDVGGNYTQESLDKGVPYATQKSWCIPMA